MDRSQGGGEGPPSWKPLRGGISKPDVEPRRGRLSHIEGGRLEAAPAPQPARVDSRRPIPLRRKVWPPVGGTGGNDGSQPGERPVLAGGRLGFEGDILQTLSLARSAVDDRLIPACPTAARRRPRSSTGPGKGQGRRRNARSGSNVASKFQSLRRPSATAGRNGGSQPRRAEAHKVGEGDSPDPLLLAGGAAGALKRLSLARSAERSAGKAVPASAARPRLVSSTGEM